MPRHPTDFDVDLLIFSNYKVTHHDVDHAQDYARCIVRLEVRIRWGRVEVGEHRNHLQPTRYKCIH